MQKVGLDPNLKRRVGKYSLGMRQRLGLAQAIMENPDLIILDEPMNGLDKDGVKDMRQYLLDLKAQGKYTGRKPIPTDWTRFGQFYGEWKSKSITGRDFMRRMNMSANTFYRRVREYEIRHGIAEQTSA